MIRIDRSPKDSVEVLDALRGDYGDVSLPNGIRGRFQGGLYHFEGLFDGSQETVEIPRIPHRIVVMFAGDDFACGVLVEPNAGFVAVPESARGKRFAVLSNGMLY